MPKNFNRFLILNTWKAAQGARRFLDLDWWLFKLFNHARKREQECPAERLDMEAYRETITKRPDSWCDPVKGADEHID